MMKFQPNELSFSSDVVELKEVKGISAGKCQMEQSAPQRAMHKTHCCVATTRIGSPKRFEYNKTIEAAHSSSQCRSVGSAILLLLPIADQV
jgi:hypothetical protein